MQVGMRVVLLSLSGVVGFECWGSDEWIWGIMDSYMRTPVFGPGSRIEAYVGYRLSDCVLVRCDG